MSISYSGYELEPLPDQMFQTKKWSTKINIILQEGTNCRSKIFESDKFFNTKEEAEKYSIDFGKHVIDTKQFI